MNWGAITRVAYGPLSLSPESLGLLTYGEFLDMWRGWKYARKLRMQENAQLAAWVIQPHTKRPVKATDLLKTDKIKKKTTQEKSNQVVSDMLNQLGGGTLWQQ